MKITTIGRPPRVSIRISVRVTRHTNSPAWSTQAAPARCINTLPEHKIPGRIFGEPRVSKHDQNLAVNDSPAVSL
jgi:hypothetical protein